MKKVIIVLTFLLILSRTITVFAKNEEWICPKCGATASMNYCSECGEPKPSEEWVCPNCGETATGYFCSNCGNSREKQSEEDAKQINGFRDYAWGVSFDEVKTDLEKEFGADSLYEELTKEDNQYEETEGPLKGFILMEDYEKMSVAGYKAEAYWLFDTDGLCAGGYYFMAPWDSYFEEIKDLYQDIYGESSQALSNDKGAVSIWRDGEDNTILMLGGEGIMPSLIGMTGGVEVVYANATNSNYVFDKMGIDLELFPQNTNSNEGV